jgi:hypothetical protein
VEEASGQLVAFINGASKKKNRDQLDRIHSRTSGSKRPKE